MGLPVRLHGIQLGRPVDLLLDPDTRRAVGLDLLCGDEVHRFLPVAVRQLPISGNDDVLQQSDLSSVPLDRAPPQSAERKRAGTVEVQLVLLEEDFVAVDRRRREVAAIVANERIPFDAALRFAPARRSAA